MKTITMHLPHGRDTNNPKKIVIHSMAEIVEDSRKSTKSWPYHFAIDYLDIIGLSVHVLVCPSGLIIRCRDDYQRAWHAKGYNKDSLGIEFLVSGAHDYPSFLKAIKKPYLTNAQAHAGHKIIMGWCHKYNISANYIYTHSQISPKRKKDPGFTWQQLQEMVRINETHE